MHFLKIMIGVIVSFAIVNLLTGQLQLGIIAGLAAGVGSAKWIRIKKQVAKDEVEYDERINANIREFSFQAFSVSNLLLLVYLLVSDLILNEQLIKASYLIAYLAITFIVAFYVIPLLARQR